MGESARMPKTKQCACRIPLATISWQRAASSSSSCRLEERRDATILRGGGFIGLGDSKEDCLGERTADDLQAERQAVRAGAALHADCRGTGDVGWQGHPSGGP